MVYAFVVTFIPHEDHGFWLWSIHNYKMECVMLQPIGSTGFKTPELALAAAQLAWKG